MTGMDAAPEVAGWRAADVELRVSVDPVLITFRDRRLHVLLRRRAWEPFRDMWALPGVINPAGEQIGETMWRELRRLGFPKELWVEQLKTFDRPAQTIGGHHVPGRDPRGRVVSVAYFAVVPPAQTLTTMTAFPACVEDELALWWSLDKLPDLAFDHREIVDYALWRLRNKIQYAPVAFELLSEEFTLTDLQDAYEAVLGFDLDKRNFRRKMISEKVVIATDGFSRREKRPARLYRSNDRQFVYSPRSQRSRTNSHASVQ